MEGRDYEVGWNARGMDFNYNGTISVYATDENNARDRAIKTVSKKMVIPRQLITVKSVKVSY